MIQIELFLELQGIIFSVMLIVLRVTNTRLRKERLTPIFLTTLVMNIGQLGSDFLSVVYNKSQTHIGWVINHVSIFTLYLFLILLIMTMAIFVEFYVVEDGIFKLRECPWVTVTMVLCLVNLVGLFLTPSMQLYYAFDEFNVYSRQPLHVVYMILEFAAVLVIWIALIARYKMIQNEKLILLALYFLFPTVGGILQWIFYGHEFINIGTGISVVVIMTVSGRRSQKHIREQEALLNEIRSSLLNSQIKPHFMFNSLAVIQSLIDEDPEAAKEAISYFSRYLRKGLDPTKGEHPVSIQEELDYVECYLHMQHLRFGNKVKVKIEVEDDRDFEIPFLSIQPLAENAINHGIRQKMEGGTVLIRVYTTEKYHVVDVIDDGVGFDPEILKQRTAPDEHVGLANVKERVKLLCGGKLVIESECGRGTKISIRIPVRTDLKRPMRESV